jgi:integrase/recombinase XerD
MDVSETLPDLVALIPSWHLAMRSARKSPKTVTTYTAGVTSFLSWCERTGTPAELTKAHAQGWVTDLLDGGAQAKTADTWLGGLKRFAAWLADERELPSDPLLRMPAPKLDQKVINPLTDDELKRLIEVCHGRSFRDRRDEAIVRLMAETGMRASEVVDLQVADVDLARGLVVVHRGKGGKGRIAPFGPHAATALDRYLRMRRQHADQADPQLFVGAQRKSFSYWGLAKSLRERAKDAGIEGFHLHLMRHTAATRWLAAGGSEGGLMAVAGWTNRQMLDRYTAATASERAAAEARTLGLGEL